MGGRRRLDMVEPREQIVEVLYVLDRKHPIKALAQYAQVTFGQQADGDDAIMRHCDRTLGKPFVPHRGVKWGRKNPKS